MPRDSFVALRDQGFVVSHDGIYRSVLWGDICEIHSAAAFMGTYDEDYLIFNWHSHNLGVLELDRDFKLFEAELYRRFPTFPKHWRVDLATVDYNTAHLQWERPTPPKSFSSRTAVPPGP